MGLEGSNGNGKSAVWFPLGAGMTVLIALGGAFGAAYARDQDRLEKRQDADEAHFQEFLGERIGQREADAYTRGRVDQRLDQLTEHAESNTSRISSSFKELDDKLQREMRLIDETTRGQVDAIDRRLQAEMATLVDGLRTRMAALEEWRASTAMNRWTKDDQERFEDKLGLGLQARP